MNIFDVVDYKIDVQDFTNGGKCSNCGKCCSNLLPLSNQEVNRIKAYIKKHGIKEQRHNVANGVDMTCPFRDEANKKCLIYSIRPAICRHFMCNQSFEDIQRNKLNYHKINRVVFMRSEFFGNTEDMDFVSSLLRGEFYG